MKTAQLNEDKQPTYDSERNGILVADLLQYLTGLAKLNEDEKVGNSRLAAGLRDLTTALRPFSDRYIAEWSDFLATNGKSSFSLRRKSPARNRVDLPAELDNISHDAVEQILSDRRYTLFQLAELGFRRFGISRSSLAHRSKKDAVESIRSALGNEKALDAISQVARKAGQARTS